MDPRTCKQQIGPFGQWGFWFKNLNQSQDKDKGNQDILLTQSRIFYNKKLKYGHWVHDRVVLELKLHHWALDGSSLDIRAILGYEQTT